MFIALFLSEIEKIIDQRPRVYEIKVDDNVNAMIANKNLSGAEMKRIWMKLESSTTSECKGP